MIGFFLLLFTLYVSVRILYLTVFKTKRNLLKNSRTIIVIGSGGHTFEMIKQIKTLNPDLYQPRLYVMAETDTSSLNKVTELEDDFKTRSKTDYELVKIPRSREVGQSYFSSVFTTLYSSLKCVPVIFQFKPDLILCNGPGTCIPICFIGFIRNALLFSSTRIVFIESICRVLTLSLSGKLLLPIADVVIVQWEQLHRKYPKTVFLGRLLLRMPLKGIKVLELAGLAPAPFCGAILADFGASVVRIDKVNASSDLDVLTNGKKSLALNLKDERGVTIFKKLCSTADVLIEPFRKGVMEGLGLGPQVLLKENPGLIYARLTGFGQTGPYSSMAGHDINFLSVSGVLSFLGRKNEKPTFPANLLADFGGGGLTCAFGILLALFERSKSKKGQVIDCSMVEGAAYLSSWLFRSQNLLIWGNKRGQNVLDTGAHFYDTYETSDGKYVAIGALESQFYEKLVDKLNASELSNQWSDFDGKKEIISKIIKTKTRDEWCKIFDGTDVCVTPVLDKTDVDEHAHNKERQSFIRLNDDVVVPKPAPRLSRTPGASAATSAPVPNGAHTKEILLQLGYTNEEIANLHKNDVIGLTNTSKL